MGFFSDFVGGITGRNAADASKDAAATQAASADKAIAFQEETRDLAREDLAPFKDFGASQINPLAALLTGQGQADYLQNNPLFTAALDSINTATMNNRAARGKLGSGGTLNALQNNYLATALPFIQDQRNALFNSVNLGQSSAAGQANTALSTGNNISDLNTQRGNALASGIAGSSAATTQGANNLMNLGLSAAAIFCDERLKEDIKEVGRDEFGGIYEFRYIGDDKLFKGRLAQELSISRPDAVRRDTSTGYLTVSPEFAPQRIS